MNKKQINIHSTLGPDKCFIKVNMKHATPERMKTLYEIYPNAVLITSYDEIPGVTYLDFYNSYKIKIKKNHFTGYDFFQKKNYSFYKFSYDWSFKLHNYSYEEFFKKIIVNNLDILTKKIENTHISHIKSKISIDSVTYSLISSSTVKLNNSSDEIYKKNYEKIIKDEFSYSQIVN